MNNLNKQKYQCGICGKEWNTPIEQAHCIMECDKIEKIKSEHARTEKLRVVEQERIIEIQNAFNKAINLIKEYKSDYRKPLSVDVGCNSALFPLLHFLDFTKL